MSGDFGATIAMVGRSWTGLACPIAESGMQRQTEMASTTSPQVWNKAQQERVPEIIVQRICLSPEYWNDTRWDDLFWSEPVPQIRTGG